MISFLIIIIISLFINIKLALHDIKSKKFLGKYLIFYFVLLFVFSIILKVSINILFLLILLFVIIFMLWFFKIFNAGDLKLIFLNVWSLILLNILITNSHEFNVLFILKYILLCLSLSVFFEIIFSIFNKEYSINKFSFNIFIEKLYALFFYLLIISLIKKTLLIIFNINLGFIGPILLYFIFSKINISFKLNIPKILLIFILFLINLKLGFIFSYPILFFFLFKNIPNFHQKEIPFGVYICISFGIYILYYF